MITAVPAQMPDSLPGEPYWMMRLDGGGLLRVWRLDSMPDDGMPCVGQEYDVRAVSTGNFYNARQPGGVIQAGPSLGNLIIRKINGKDIAFFCAPCGLPTVETVAVFVAVVDLSTIPTLLRSAVIGTSNLDCWLPSIAVNASGDMLLNLLTSSPTQYISNQVSLIPCGQRAIANKATAQAAPSSTTTVCQSTVDLDGNGRAGDISGCVLDFVDDSFWTVNEVPDNSFASVNYNWTSRIANIAVESTPPVPPTNPTTPFSGDIKVLINGKEQIAHVDGTATLLLPPP
jgi:hypothetical protein